MNFKKTLLTLLAASLIGITGCSKPKVEKAGDLTGGWNSRCSAERFRCHLVVYWEERRGYIRASQYYPEKDGMELFTTDSGKTYFFDGVFYKQFINP